MPVTFPALLPASVEVQRIAAQRLGRDAFSQGIQVVDDGARMFRIVVRMQVLDSVDAALMLAFFHDLDGMADTFEFDLDPWWRGDDPAPGTRVFRLAEGQSEWLTDPGIIWEAGFEALEDIEAA